MMFHNSRSYLFVERWSIFYACCSQASCGHWCRSLYIFSTAISFLVFLFYFIFFFWSFASGMILIMVKNSWTGLYEWQKIKCCSMANKQHKCVAEVLALELKLFTTYVFYIHMYIHDQVLNIGNLIVSFMTY